jgi:GNAT superfamily N-acetyltransferase
MSISTSISRFAVHLSRHGFNATARRAALVFGRALFSNRMVLFYYDLSRQGSWPADLTISVKVERKRSEFDLDSQDLQEIIKFWNPKLASRQIKERFRRGASMWMIKSEDRLAGYGWTLQGCTIEPHYFRFGEDDVHLFDFLVFPKYRGQGLNSLLVTHILRNLAAESSGRAFIEAAEWNHAQLSSLRKTPFHRIGQARKLTILRRIIVCWDENKTAEQEQKDLSVAMTGQKGSNVLR